MTAYPHIREAWAGDFEGARREIALLCRALVDEAGERVVLLVADEECELSARAAIGSCVDIELARIPYGDSWTRDTGPLIRRRPDAGLDAAVFRFDGWGGKYRMEGDEEVGRRLAERLGLSMVSHDFVLEGGAVDVDGEGTCLTTESCLLDRTRNADADHAMMEARLKSSLGVEKVIWLERGLLNDHTDGHIDTLARFVAPGHVVCMEPSDPSDLNAEAMLEIIARLEVAVDARGRRLKVTRIPSPDVFDDELGMPLPASYTNFYIGNRAVIVPSYGDPNDEAAVEALAGCFPDRHVLGSPSRHILGGGGALHCVTQQIPRAKI